MRPVSKTSRLAALLVWMTLTAASATYIPWNGHGPVADVSSSSGGTSNDVEQNSPERHRRQKPVFRNDAVRLRLTFLPQAAAVLLGGVAKHVVTAITRNGLYFQRSSLESNAAEMKRPHMVVNGPIAHRYIGATCKRNKTLCK